MKGYKLLEMMANGEIEKDEEFVRCESVREYKIKLDNSCFSGLKFIGLPPHDGDVIWTEYNLDCEWEKIQKEKTNTDYYNKGFEDGFKEATKTIMKTYNLV